MRTSDAEIAGLLRELLTVERAILAGLERLTGTLARGRHSTVSATAARALSRADHARLAQVLPAVAGAKGSDEFTTSELFELRAVRPLLDGLTPAHVGRLFERAAGIPVEGYAVAHSGTELQRHLWRVHATV